MRRVERSKEEGSFLEEMEFPGQNWQDLEYISRSVNNPAEREGEEEDRENAQMGSHRRGKHHDRIAFISFK
jgi:hypothetical protein